MTSLSNVFRSHEAIEQEGSRRVVRIRTFDQPVDEMNEVEEFQGPTREEIEQERAHILNRATEEAEAIKASFEQQRQQVEQEIEEKRERWKEEKKQLEAEAFEQGYDAGFGEGERKALEQWRATLAEANDIVERAKEQGDRYVEEQERTILELALVSAERIIQRELSRDETVYTDVVKRALKEARESKEIKLYVSPKYYELVASSQDELTELFPPDVPFLIFANDDFEDEECYVETNHGRIVVTIDEQLNVLKEQLIELLESGD